MHVTATRTNGLHSTEFTGCLFTKKKLAIPNFPFTSVERDSLEV